MWFRSFRCFDEGCINDLFMWLMMSGSQSDLSVTKENDDEI
jgi:hypothetical protein